MGYRTLVECVDDLRAHGQLVAIEAEIDPHLEAGAVQVQGSVLVPPGAWCDMIDSSVTGSVIAVASTGLRIANSTIGGSMVATGIHGADDPLSFGANVVFGYCGQRQVLAVEPRPVRGQHGEGQDKGHRQHGIRERRVR